HGARRLGLDAREVRDALARLDREGERVRHLRRPSLEDAFLRKAIKRVVDLDRREATRVKAEHPVVFEVGGIERAFPLLEREAARARVNLHDALVAGSLDAARLALSASIRSMIFVPDAGATSAVMSWPSTFRWIVSSTRSRTVSLYFAGSKVSVDDCSM